MSTTFLCDIIRPSDWHHHFREGDDWLSTTVPLCFSQFEYAIAMPNLNKPIQTYNAAQAYYSDILRHYPTARPVMTYYLNNDLTPAEIYLASQSVDPNRKIIGAKYYPKGATTNSDLGVTGYKPVRAQLSAMNDSGLYMLIHGEDHAAPVYEREQSFIRSGQIRQIMEEFGELRITLEHISTRYATEYLHDMVNIQKSNKIAATITPHHLKYTVDDIFKHGCNPRMYCCPILKTAEDRLALQEFATAGYSNVFLGTDSAPHTDETKTKCGTPGIFNVHSALNDVADLFIEADKLAWLEAFISTNGCEWYQKLIPSARVKLFKDIHPNQQQRIPLTTFLRSGASVTPLNSGARLTYRFSD